METAKKLCLTVRPLHKACHSISWEKMQDFWGFYFRVLTCVV